MAVLSDFDAKTIAQTTIKNGIVETKYYQNGNLIKVTNTGGESKTLGSAIVFPSNVKLADTNGILSWMKNNWQLVFIGVAAMAALILKD